VEGAQLDPSPTPPDLFEVEEQLAFLHGQLDQLSEKYRLVLTLRYLQGLFYEEISTTLNLPMGTVKTHIQRARGILMERKRAWDRGKAREKNRGDFRMNIECAISTEQEV
jgi:RNA polymerase sigma-70 factor (ECF subfamily)